MFLLLYYHREDVFAPRPNKVCLHRGNAQCNLRYHYKRNIFIVKCKIVAFYAMKKLGDLVFTRNNSLIVYHCPIFCSYFTVCELLQDPARVLCCQLLPMAQGKMPVCSGSSASGVHLDSGITLP